LLRFCEYGVEVLFFRPKVCNIAAEVFPLIFPKDSIKVVKLSLVGEFIKECNQAGCQSAGIAANKIDNRVSILSFREIDNTDTIMPNSPGTTSEIPEFPG
jgi:hypothetical protein